MKRQELIDYCLTLPDTYEDYPFHDNNWTVMRCKGNKKIFAWIFERQENIWINLKVDTEWRDFWRDAFEAIQPAYHLNKTHWNSIIMDGTVPENTIKQLIEESYDLIKPKKKPKREKPEDKRNGKKGNPNT